MKFNRLGRSRAQYTRFSDDNSPSLHRSQDVRPENVWNHPASQSSHDHVMLLAYLPLSHGVQRPSCTISPDGQCVGAGDGTGVGAAEGLGLVGMAVGTGVGALDGAGVGASDGAGGAGVGSDEGIGFGTGVGCEVGIRSCTTTPISTP